MELRQLIAVAGVLFISQGCEKKIDQGSLGSEAAITQVTGSSVVPPAKNDKALPAKNDTASEFMCEVETEGTIWSKVLFSASHSEIFLVTESGGILVPVKVTKQEPDKLTIAVRWLSVDPVKQPAALQNGTITRVSSDKVSFDFDSIKGFICKTSDLTAHPFQKNIAELGFPPGKYLDPKKNAFVTFQADAQKFIVEAEGQFNVFYYRTISATSDEFKLAAFMGSPSDDKSSMGINTTLTRIGEDYLMDLAGSLKLKLSAVK